MPLKDLLLGSDTGSLQTLQEAVAERLHEGYGEAVFDIGFENNGESMTLTIDEYNVAQARLFEAARLNHADCKVLLTKNVGGDVEAASTQAKGNKYKDCSAKVMIRRVPATVEDVIETRIAVVGNGR